MNARRFASVGAVLFCAVLTVLTALGQPPARAQFPNSNGRIVFSGGKAGNPFAPTKIYSVRPDGAGLRRLTDPTNAFDGLPDVSANGQRIVFVRGGTVPGSQTTVFRMGIGGGNLTQVGPSGRFEPVWSPNGQEIAYRTGGGLLAEIAVMNTSGGVLRTLTNNSKDDRQPAWSPDGTRIAFTREAGAAEEQQIFVMNEDGSNQVKLTSGAKGYGHLDWSPDGTKIVFDRVSGGSAGTIGVINANGTGLTILLEDDRSFWPDWSPDGTKIVFSRDPSGGGGEPDIWVMGATGGNLARVLARPGSDRSPDWQPIPPTG